MNGEITGIRGANHTWPCQWVIFSVNAGVGCRLTNQGTLERKRTEGEKQRKKVNITDVDIVF